MAISKALHMSCIKNDYGIPNLLYGHLNVFTFIFAFFITFEIIINFII